MTSASRLRQAARRCELGALEQLSAACGIVIDTGRLIHALQKERGCSAIYLASEGRRFAADRSERIADSQSAELAVRRRLTELAELPEQTAQGARLLRRGAEVWQALDALETVRGAVATRRMTPDDATRDYNGLIGGLLGLVFEAADGGGDTRITLALVALFHLLKGKELAGQERACGAHGFTAGGFDAAHRRLLGRLLEAQTRCFATFLEFASPEARACWEAALPESDLAPIQRLREIAGAAPVDAAAAGVSDPAQLGELWFALTTRRIDAMHRVEAFLGEELASLCAERLAAARQALAAPPCDTGPSALDPLLGDTVAATPGGIDGQATAEALASPLNRSLLELVRSQTDRLQGLGNELANTRKALRERKLVERAKGVIMANQAMSEEQAYRFMRKTAMDQSRSMADLSRAILDLADLLPSQQPARHGPDD